MGHLLDNRSSFISITLCLGLIVLVQAELGWQIWRSRRGCCLHLHWRCSLSPRLLLLLLPGLLQLLLSLPQPFLQQPVFFSPSLLILHLGQSFSILWSQRIQSQIVCELFFFLFFLLLKFHLVFYVQGRFRKLWLCFLHRRCLQQPILSVTVAKPSASSILLPAQLYTLTSLAATSRSAQVFSLALPTPSRARTPTLSCEAFILWSYHHWRCLFGVIPGGIVPPRVPGSRSSCAASCHV
mmetsp:Transcript_19493/g.45300  ORF Transcript_19493/g.45300 Transcript_19493/m.45300 type:complete len:239 (-) Transcript_19493:469-1185(-)